MITLLSARDLGTVTQPGVNISCHFSFAEYRDPAHVHWGQIRAINTAVFEPFAEFRLREEDAKDIVTIILKGTFFAEVDGRVPLQLQEGDIHLLSAGQGIQGVTWWAASPGSSFVQVWLLPDEEGGVPESVVHHRPVRHGQNALAILASGFAEDSPEDTDSGQADEPVPLRASARIMGMILQSGVTTHYTTGAGRLLYLVVLSGVIKINDQPVSSGAGAAICNETEVRLHGETDTTVLLIDAV
ncbi:hypothetical protein AD940_01550 [Gluconobacter thailandicus]|uniref:pirin family protein n=1 Tax=Gluconobacter thailandicus TaxID=257438 RepID=UPI0007776CEF|nr:hypothetical protein [Gluconobacter thailandicus]KXV35770.1 hypothetical protein AD940_01550 [Gluconobacter thailandicus]